MISKINGAGRGFTVIEVVIALALFSGIMLLVMLFSLDIADFSVQYQQDIAAKIESQLALSTMLSQFRSITASANGSYPILAASSTSFTFYADGTADGIPDQIRYFFGTSTVNRGLIRSTGTPALYPSSTEIVVPVITNMSTGTFRYYSSAFTGSEPPLTYPLDVSQIKAIQFQVTVDQATTSRPGPLNSSITVTFRNLRIQ